jgi:hypothetical protein
MKTHTLVELLRLMSQEFDTLKSNNFPLNERELAKDELVKSLLDKVDSGYVNESFYCFQKEEIGMKCYNVCDVCRGSKIEPN